MQARNDLHRTCVTEGYAYASEVFCTPEHDAFEEETFGYDFHGSEAFEYHADTTIVASNRPTLFEERCPIFAASRCRQYLQ